LKAVNTGACTSERALTISLIPKPTASFSYPPIICENQTSVNLTDLSTVNDQTATLAKWWWNIGGSILQTQQPPAFIPFQPGPLKIKLLVTSSEGCRSDTSVVTLPVHFRPKSEFKWSPRLCDNEIIQFTDLSEMPPGSGAEAIHKWLWQFDNGSLYVVPSPSLMLPVGMQHAKLITETNFGCKSIIADSSMVINKKPQIQLDINDSCVNRNIQYRATDLNNSTANWYWNFGSGFTADAATITRSYFFKGAQPLTLIAESTKGCKDTLQRPFAIYDNKAFAGRDTLVAKGEPMQLNANGDPGAKYQWTPPTGLNDATIENPVAILDQDQLYQLDVWTREGCDSHTKIFIKRFKGPELYIPSAFTPNGDQRNDLLKVFPVGIKSFTFFAVYNRYGELIFRTTDYSKGWDGTYKGKPLDSGTFVAIAQAIDYKGKLLSTKGTVILLR
jgi:gliding motility-associated-like protein